MTPISQTKVVKNSVAGVSDVVFGGGYLNILGAATAFPSVYYRSITNQPKIQKSLVEIATIRTVTFVAAANTIYSFNVAQDVFGNGQMVIKQVIFDSTGTAATAAVILAGLMASANSNGLEITATGASSTVTLTANAGYALFMLSNASNVTFNSTSAQTAYTPSGTASLAITAVIAPDGTAATAIAVSAGVVTVTTLAAHLLRPGDYVQIASVATMTLTYTDNVPLSNNADYGKTFSGAAGGKFRVATVPSATTFTLDGATGSGTNSGTITITALNVAFLTTSGSVTITTGKTLAVAGVATMTIAPISANVVGTAGASGNFRVGVGGTGTRFLIEAISAVGTNSGTITINEVGQAVLNSGTQLLAQGNTDAVTTNTYSSVMIVYGEPAAELVGTQRNLARAVILYVNEGDADTPAFLYALENALEGRATNMVASPAPSSSTT